MLQGNLPSTQTAVMFVVDYYRDILRRALDHLDKSPENAKVFISGILEGTYIGPEEQQDE